MPTTRDPVWECVVWAVCVANAVMAVWRAWERDVLSATLGAVMVVLLVRTARRARGGGAA